MSSAGPSIRSTRSPWRLASKWRRATVAVSGSISSVVIRPSGPHGRGHGERGHPGERADLEQPLRARDDDQRLEQPGLGEPAHHLRRNVLPSGPGGGLRQLPGVGGRALQCVASAALRSAPSRRKPRRMIGPPSPLKHAQPGITRSARNREHGRAGRRQPAAHVAPGAGRKVIVRAAAQPASGGHQSEAASTQGDAGAGASAGARRAATAAGARARAGRRTATESGGGR